MPTKRITLNGVSKPFLGREAILTKLYMYLRQFNELSEEETKKLFKMYHEGTTKEKEKARDLLCKHNMRLVISMARQFCTTDDNLMDLIEEGNYGLLYAIDKFDVNNGALFHGYAMYWIRRYIGRFKIEYTPIVQQTNRSKTANVVKEIVTQLTQKQERYPTTDEILEEYNRKNKKNKLSSEGDVVNVEYIYIDSLEPFGGEVVDSQAYLDYNKKTVSTNEYMLAIDKEENKSLVSELFKVLNYKEKQVVSMKFGLNGKMESGYDTIALHLGCTPERCRQIYKEAIKKMHKKTESLNYAF